MSIEDTVLDLKKNYKEIKENPVQASNYELPGKVYFIKDHNILALPREEGECRYPFGDDGFNYWVYASGYMHSNEGLFSPYLRASEGSEPKVAFFVGFLKKDGTYDVVPILQVPVVAHEEDVERYTIFTKGSSYYIAEVRGLIFAIRTFVDKNKQTYYTLFVMNETNESQTFFISSYFNPFLKHAVMEGTENRWFRQGEVIAASHFQNLNNFLIEVYEERDRGAMSPNYGVFTRYMEISEGVKVLSIEETTSRYDYVGGVKSSLHSPLALYRGSLAHSKKVTSFTEVAIAADLIHLSLEKGAKVRLDTVMSCAFEELDMKELITKVMTGNEIDHIEEELLLQEAKKSKGMQAEIKSLENSQIKENVFNSFFEELKKQVEFCSLIKGYIQLSNFSLIGIRDVYQALEALTFWRPQIAREKMLEGLNFITPEGRCPRQYSLPRFEGENPNMDLRPFIDQGAWVITTIINYLKLTQDFDFLEEQCGYYEFVNDKAHVAKKLNKQSSVLEHLIEMMNYLLKNRDHEYTKCVCALYGDWNDSLDGLGVSLDKSKAYGTGVSVMASLQVYQNCEEMIELLEKLDKEHYKKLIVQYKLAKAEIKEGLFKYAIVENGRGEKKILHGWGDKRSYLVGSFIDPDGLSRDGLTSNAFWILSKLYDEDPSIRTTILKAYERLDSKYGLKTFEPHFEKGTYGVGRIPNLPKGTAENGAAYIHASTFGLMSLFRIGESEKAWEELEKILPFTHEKISVSPYVMPNSYGHNEEKQIDGESMQDWQTGSSNVMLKTLIRFVFGVEPTFNGIWIGPAKAIPFKETFFEIDIRGTQLSLHYTNQQRDKRQFILGGEEVEGRYDSIMKLEKLWIDNKFIKNGKKITIDILD